MGWGIREKGSAVVGKILTLKGVEVYFTGLLYGGDWNERRVIMPADEIVQEIKVQLDRMDREPEVLEIAFFRGIEYGLS